jgi:hypothetical protein
MDRDPHPSTPWIYRFVKSRRGQSETLGVVLLLGLAVAGTVVVVTYGAPAIDETKRGMQAKSVEHGMTQFDATVAEVALGRSPAMQANLPSTGPQSSLRVTDDGWMRVRVYNQSTGNLRMQLLNESLGAVEYEMPDGKIVYQGGGVWRKQGDSSTMVSPPEFHYRQETLTLPVVTVSGSATNPNSLSIERKDPTKRVFPDANAPGNRTNPLRNSLINVTIQSEHYRAWGSFFNERTAGDPAYDHDDNRVTFTLVVAREEATTVTAGIIAGGGTDLAVEQNAEADSYNSSNGPYSSTVSENTSLIVGGDFTLENNAIIRGDLVVGGSTTVKNNALVAGNLSYGGTLSLHKKATVEGDISSGANVYSPDPVGWLIDKREQQTKRNNDNDDADIDNDSTPRLQSTPADPAYDDGDCTATCELDEGQYYLRKVSTYSNSKIELDNEDGPITIYVDGNFYLGQGTEIELESDNHPVRIFVKSDTTLENNVIFDVPGQKAPLMWIYHKPGASATVNNNVEFTGVIYGPASASSQGVDVTISNVAIIRGALVGKVNEISNVVDFSYDEALANAEAIPENQERFIPTVSYLHVTVNNVTVTN